MTFAFCLASGAAYLVNDVMDAEGDRRQPAHRQPADRGGDLAPGLALGAALISAIVALGIAAALNPKTLAALGGFLALQAAYSPPLKHLIFVDAMAIASGFVLRAAAGALAVGVDISPWLPRAPRRCRRPRAVQAPRRGRGAGRRAEPGPAGARGVLHRPARRSHRGDHPVGADELHALLHPGRGDDAMPLTVPFVLYGIFRLPLDQSTTARGIPRSRR